MEATATEPLIPQVMPPPLASPMDKMADFHDSISPMLVKELRQGLRAKTFVSAFIGLHGMITFLMLMATISDTVDPGGAISAIILGFFGFTALVIQPLRCIGCLHQEIKQNTLDALQLTRLGSWGIVMGKWFANVSQTLLLLVSIIPYLILRYFLGGMNFSAEILILFSISALSVFLTSAIIGVSAAPLILLRTLLPLAGLFVIFFGGINLVSSRLFIGRVSMDQQLAAFGVCFLLGSYLSYFALSMCSSSISTIAESFSKSRRIITAVAILICGGIVWALPSHMELEILASILILIVTPFLLLTLSEPLQLLPLHCRKAAGKGFVGKWFQRLFYPGWPSGTVWALIFILLSNVILILAHPSSAYDSEFETSSFAMNEILGLFLLSHIINCLLPLKKTTFTYRFYVILVSIQMITFILQIGISIWNRSSNAEILSALPLGWVIDVRPLHIGKDEYTQNGLYYFHLKLLLYFFISIGLALKALSKVKRVEEQALSPEAAA